MENGGTRVVSWDGPVIRRWEGPLTTGTVRAFSLTQLSRPRTWITLYTSGFHQLLSTVSEI